MDTKKFSLQGCLRAASQIILAIALLAGCAPIAPGAAPPEPVVGQMQKALVAARSAQAALITAGAARIVPAATAAMSPDADIAVSEPPMEGALAGDELPAEVAGKPELADKRTANSATYDLGDGKYALVQKSHPVHYQDAGGAWQRIDPAFVAETGGWINRTNALKTGVGARSGRANLTNGNLGVGWDPYSLEVTDAAGNATLWAKVLPEANALTGTLGADGRSVTYPSSWSEPTLLERWVSGYGQSEYSLRIAERFYHGDTESTEISLNSSVNAVAAQETLDLRVTLHLFPGAQVQVDGKPVAAAGLPLETSGALTFVNDAGETLILQPPQAYEEGNPAQRVAGRYRLTAGANADSLELAARFPYEWLNASERQYPVVLDPQFQVTPGAQNLARMATYRNGVVDAWGPLNPDTLHLGHQWTNSGTLVDRIFVRFPLPSLPTGATVTAATLEALPDGAGWSADHRTDHAETEISLYKANANWWAASPPATAANLGTAQGTPHTLRYSDGDTVNPLTWNVLPLVQEWRSSSNNGVILAVTNESCVPCPCSHGYCSTNRNCTGFDFNPQPTLEKTSGGWRFAGDSGGIRLIVTYTGPTLDEGEIIPDAGDLPFGNPSSGGNYHDTAHEYRVEGLSGAPYYWQAVVARGLGGEFGDCPVGPGHSLCGQYLDGVTSLDLRNSEDRILTSTTAIGSLSYVLLNRYAAYATDYHAWVNPNRNDVPSAGYDVRLIKQTNSYQISPGVPVNIPGAFNTDNPVRLWHLVFAANTHNRVDIEITGHNHNDEVHGDPIEATYQYARHFKLQMFPNSGAYRSAMSSFKTKGVTPETDPLPYGAGSLTSSIFDTPSSASYALALAYDGPAATVYTCHLSGEFCDGNDLVTEMLAFDYNVRVTSCAGNTFPTRAGTCQEIRCPTSSFPAGNHFPIGDFELWSEDGWDGAESENGVAPLIGPAGGANAPTVAIIGGKLSYAAQQTRIDDAESTVMLVQCAPPAENVSAPGSIFAVYDGQMRSGTSSTNMLIPTAWAWGNATLIPWPATDLENLSNTYVVTPLTGRVVDAVTVQRDVGADLEFTVQYWADATGWPSLTSQVNQTANSDTPPPVAGVLNLDLGDDFTMDTDAASGKDAQRMFRTIRALNARVAQPENMGGASNPVRAVIVGVGQDATGPNADPPGPTCAENGAYCLDIRAPDDVYSNKPNRKWQMPDIHINGEAALVMVNTPGKLEAWSADHPAMANRPQAVSQNFSFDTFSGEVSIRQGRCTATDNEDTTIIEGDTTITLPMIGDGANGGIAVGFTLCGNPDVALRQMTFKVHPPVAIPVGSSGLFATELNGTIDISPSDTTLNFNLQFYYGDPGTFNGTGGITISTKGMFSFQGDGKILGVVDAHGNLWVAWNPLDTGFEMSLHYGLGDIAALDGTVRAHAWQGQGWQHKYNWLPDNDEDHFAAQIAATFTIYEGALIDIWPLVIPPVDLSRELEIAFGQFCTNDDCSSYEWGIKAAVAVCGYHAGVYYGFDHGVSIILGNDDHTLIDQYGGSSYARTNSSSPLSLGKGPGVRVLAAPQAVNGEVSLPVTVTADTEELLLGLGWQTGTLTMNLYRPNGELVFPNPGFSIRISDTTRTDNNVTTYSKLMGVQLMQPGPEMAGIWEARIGGIIPQAHYKFAFLASTGTPGTPADHGHFIAPGAANANGTGAYNIRWNTADDAPPSSTISLYYTLYYSRTNTDPALTMYTKTVDVPIVKNWDYHSGLYPWDTSNMKRSCSRSELDPDCGMFCYNADGHCYYQIHAVVDDGANTFPPGAVSDPADFCQTCDNLPSEYAFDAKRFPGVSAFRSVGRVWLDYDTTPPSVPTGLSVDGVDGALLVRWNANPVSDKDLGAYLVEWGRVYCTTDCSWIGGGPTHAERVAPVMTPTLRIGGVTTEGLTLGQSYGVVVSAVDINGNASARSAIVDRRPNNDPSSQIQPAPFAPVMSIHTSSSVRLRWNSEGYPYSYRLLYQRVAQPSTLTQVDGIAAGWDSGEGNYYGQKYLLNLETGATYVAWAAASNSAGWYSAYSPPVTFTVSDGEDADSDGMPDDWEEVHQISFGSNDSDRDGLSDLNEYRNGADPWEQDSDADGFSDGEEVDAGTNPVNGASYPAAFTQPRLRLAEHRVNFYAKVGGNLQMFQDVSFYNDGGGTLDLSATETAQWLSALVEIGVGKNYVRLNANAADLTPGIYDAIVQVYHSGGPHFSKPQCIRVRLHLLPADNDFPPQNIFLPMVLSAYTPPQWVSEFVDVADAAKKHTSVAFDPLGNVPYISYYDASNGDLLMASRVGESNGNCGKNQAWLCRTLQSADDVGQYSSIALWRIARDWKIGVAYYNHTTHSLEYLEYDGDVWKSTVVDPGSATPDHRNGLFSSLKFDAGGNPHIAYYNWNPIGNDTLKYAHYVGGKAGNCGDTQWNCDVIESGDEMGRYAALDLDGEYRPHIAYYDSGSGLLRYARFTGDGQGNCGPDNNWQCVAIEPIEAPSGDERLVGLNALSADSARIAYVTIISKTQTLRYADTTPGACGPKNSWTCATIIENAGGVALNTQGSTVHIAYQNTAGGALNLAYPLEIGHFGNCGPFISGKLRGWQCEEMEEGGAYPAIALRSDGLAIITHYTSAEKTLRAVLQQY